jgi:hypothetical protein
MRRVATIDQDAGLRRNRLGDIGEALAYTLLARNGFSNIRDLNRPEETSSAMLGAKKNSHFADFFAEKDGRRYVISVKARNAFEWTDRPNGTRRLNTRYKLGPNCYRLAARAAAEHKAEPAWLTIAVDGGRYSAYFGLLATLRGNTGVPMSPRARSKYTCLAEDEPHSFDPRGFENVYETRERRARVRDRLPDSATPIVTPFRRHQDAEVRSRSARHALAAILPLELYPPHKRELLSI